MKQHSLAYLSKEYDRLYNEGQKILNAYNPCMANKARCLEGERCCTHCQHLGENGCKIKCLMCKLWLCHTAREINTEASKKLNALMERARELGLLRFRHTKEECFEVIKWYRRNIDARKVR
jgi:hypothetical protein